MVRIIDIKLEKDDREENKIRDEKGNFLKYKQSEYVCKIFFDNGTWCAIEFSDIEKIMRLIKQNEEYKYPNGILKGNYPFYKHIFPIWEEELLIRGFNPEDGLIKLKIIENAIQKRYKI